ncbi:Gfo/Idh/MocA family oxidoreductase [Rhizobium sp. KVB221]|uniref:Gfo/Idh/MocA family oxidoreductase n=1 Tax=Rhizobium setariae TaxID=2801340 RepID=A0A936YVA0_9HYPH|nr:Gfo/Idh/MocA family oxidoreductase [Rhizobium setariae]MBL0374266.1 Gfo/Idh/MocA family oxidoreductase [Rhizobium setariae]
MTKELKVGVIGLGEVGRHQVNGVLAASGAKLFAVADFNPELVSKTSEATGARGYATAEALIADADVEAVVICVPHKFHAGLCLKALEAGKHVFVEKPVTVTTVECDALIALADKTGKIFGASHNQLFYPPHRWLREEIAAGRIARPTLLRLRLAIGGKLGGWRADPDLTGGGLLFDAGFHRFYVARSIMGEVKAVTAMLDTADPRGVGEDVGIVTLEFRDGGRAVIEAGYHAPKGAFDDQIEAVTRDALIRIPGLEAHFEKFTDEPHLLKWSDGSWQSVEVAKAEWPDTVGFAVANFIDAVNGKAPLAVDGREARRIVEIVEAVYQSATEGRRIEL